MQCNTYDKNGKIIPKIAFDTRAEAKVSAKRMKKQKGLKVILTVYKCTLCNKFHIGKDLEWIRKKLKKK